MNENSTNSTNSTNEDSVETGWLTEAELRSLQLLDAIERVGIAGHHLYLREFAALAGTLGGVGSEEGYDRLAELGVIALGYVEKGDPDRTTVFVTRKGKFVVKRKMAARR
jgi:hypothetical protein